jgi:Tol biopolymer transport system component
MPALSKIVVYILFLLSLAAFAVAQPVLKADYQGTIDSSVAGGPRLQDIGLGGASTVSDRVDGYTRQVIDNPQGHGFSLNTTGLIGSNYTVAILFRFGQVAGRYRVFDPSNGASDPCGIYVENNKLSFEPANVTNIYGNTYIQVIISRNSDGVRRVFRDGWQTQVNNDTCFGIVNNTMRFFLDDGAENTSARIARIQVWDGAMTFPQMRAVDRLANANGGGDQSILFQSNRYGPAEIFTMNADGTNERRLTNNAATDFQARWSPDKTKIAYATQGNVTEEVVVMPADGGSGIPLVISDDFDGNAHAPSWSPDGTKILFSGCDSNFICDIYQANADGTGAATPVPGLNDPNQDEDYASYSPDGKSILFTRHPVDPLSPTGGVYLLQNTGVMTPLAQFGSGVVFREPRFSPNGLRIVFTRIVLNTNISDLFAMNRNGTELVNMSNGKFEGAAVFAPDNRTIAFYSRRDLPQASEIYRMDSISVGAELQRLTFNSVADGTTDWYASNAPLRSSTPFDFDGDGRSDYSIFRPSDSTWHLALSQSGGYYAQGWGLSGDKIVPADYNGDGKTDLAVFRPTENNWYIFNSSNGSIRTVNFGLSGDRPVPADYDADGKADIAVWRESNGGWYVAQSSNGAFRTQTWGLAGDKPVPADYDADGKSDLAVWRQGTWYLITSSDLNFRMIGWGLNGDIPVTGDYSGDGRSDYAVYRPSDGTWYIMNSDGWSTFTVPLGGVGIVPLAGDFDGDGKMDPTRYRPSDGVWTVNTWRNVTLNQAFGLNGDLPTENAFIY